MKPRRLHYVGGFILLSVCLLICLTTNVQAADAVADIMNNERFNGAINTISWLTGIVDHYSTMAITLVAFFIIAAAFLKNVCAGAYCANSKFWNKVAEAHESMEAKTLANVKDYFAGGGIMNTSVGGIGQAILVLIPNIKALTDFDDVEMEPKQYWIKAIPEMLLCICIGVFIYNGYYRDTAAVVGDFGSEVCHRVFTSVNPASFVDTITRTSRTPENIYAADKSLQGKFNHKFSMELYKVLLSESKEISDFEQKTALMRDCENKASMISSDGAKLSMYWLDDRKYDYSVGSLNMVPTKGTNVSTNTEWSDNPESTEDDSKRTIAGYLSISDMMSVAQYIDADKVYFTFVLNGTPTDGSSTGLSGVVASAGDWRGIATTTYTCPNPINVKVSTLTDGTRVVAADASVEILKTSKTPNGIITPGELINYVKSSNPDYSTWIPNVGEEQAVRVSSGYDTGGVFKFTKGQPLIETRSATFTVALQSPEQEVQEFTVQVTFNTNGVK